MHPQIPKVTQGLSPGGLRRYGRARTERNVIMTDFVDPLGEPLSYDRDPRQAREFAEEDAEAEELAREYAEEDEREGEAERSAAQDGTEVTSASEGEPLDESTPVDNLE